MTGATAWLRAWILSDPWVAVRILGERLLCFHEQTDADQGVACLR
jgi:hypothetical protein